MSGIVRLLLATLGLASIVPAASAQDDPLAGILVEYAPRSGPSLRRIEHELGTQLVAGLPATIPHRFPLTITWQGWWLPDGRGSHRWLLSGKGSAKLELGGLAAVPIELQESSSQGVSFDAARADWTEFRLQVTFADPTGSVRVAWQGPGFLPEPFPLHRLGHDPDDRAQQITLAEQRVSELRCGNCHQQLPQSTHQLSAPDLSLRVRSTDAAWLRERIVHHFESITPNEDAAAIRSALKFPLETQELDDLIAYLSSQAKTTSPTNTELPKELGNPEAGRTLLHTIGCTACHDADQDLRGESTLGFGLQNVAGRRTIDFLDQWLKNPTAVDPHAAMPAIALSESERSDLLAAFGEATRTRPQLFSIQDDQAIDRGKQLYQQWHCGQCHDSHLPAPSLSRPQDWDSGCLTKNDSPATPFTPQLLLPEDERRAIREYLAHLETSNPEDFAAQIPRGTTADLLATRHCFRCHDRGRREDAAQTRGQAFRDLDPDARARWRAPALDSIGDKFKRDALVSILTQGSQRRDWFTLRMPRHALGTSDNDDGSEVVSRVVDWLQTIDRLERSLVPEPLIVSETEAKSHGSRLVSSSGFGCISCHRIGGRSPFNAPVHATGPPLERLDQRLERAWFDRWVRAPARLVPNMEMPSFRLPVHGVLENDLDRQLATVWQSLSQEDFQLANNEPERILQQPGTSPSPAMVLTDVVRQDDRQWIAAWIAGLSNRHNLLFDGQTGSLAAWWFGDVARQYTEGKSWYWQPGGYLLAMQDGSSAVSEWQIESRDQIVAPSPQGQFVSEVEAWNLEEDSVTLHRSLHFSQESATGDLHLEETFTPLPSDANTNLDSTPQFTSSESGFRRHIIIRGDTIPTLLFSLSGFTDNPQPWSPETEIRWTLGTDPYRTVRLVESSIAPILVTEGTQLRLVPAEESKEISLVLEYRCELAADSLPFPARLQNHFESLDSTPRLDVVPGFESTLIAAGTPWMPTGLSWAANGDLFVTSLNGSIWRVSANSAGQPMTAERFSDGFAAPFGVHATDRYVDVIHKSGLMRLWDRNHDGRADQIRTLARGWGHTADYHDWAVGLPRDSRGNYWIALSCRQDERSDPATALRGTLLRLCPEDPAQETTPYRIETMADGLRFPVGMTINSTDEVFFTDNQGNYNPFNELNVFRPQAHYGFLNAWQARSGPSPPETPPAIAIPHPWTRSVNGLALLELPKPSTTQSGFGPWSGHFVACEYDTQRLVRLSLETIEGVQQGAVYPFSTGSAASQAQLLGPLTVAVSPTGELLVGAIRDSGWGGGDNIGRLLRLQFRESLIPPGIAEVKATSNGFDVRFTQPITPEIAADPKNWTVRSYRRASTPEYGGPDLDSRGEPIRHIQIAPDRQSAEIICQEPLRRGFVYRIETSDLSATGSFFPAEAHYSLHAVPQ